MAGWEDVACRRGHEDHAHRWVTVTIGGSTPYADYPPIPERLAASFEMAIYDPDVYPVDGGPYCPAHDCVSETIASLGIWEPPETIMVRQVAQAGGLMIDIGAQIGWFTLLGLAAGMRVHAIDADLANLQLLSASAKANGWDGRLAISHRYIWAGTRPLEPQPTRLVKIDVEGSEAHALAMLRPSLEAGLVEHLMMEVTPSFGPGYPELVAQLVDYGFEAYLLPPKRLPAYPLDSPDDLVPFRLDTLQAYREVVAKFTQEDVWFRHADASW